MLRPRRPSTRRVSLPRSFRSRRSNVLQQTSSSVFSHIFAYQPAGRVNVLIRGEAEQAVGEYVTGDFFRGLSVLPAAGRMIATDDDRIGASAVAVISMGYSQRRFGGAASAVGQSMLIDNVPFTVIGVAPSEFFGVDPGANPDVYLPMRAKVLFDPSAANTFLAPDFYWLQMMGRLRPGVSLEQAQAALAPPFGQWVASTAINDKQRANLPVLTSRRRGGRTRQPSPPLFEAAVCAAGDGWPDPRHRVCEHGQSPAGPRDGAHARDGRTTQPGRGTISRDTPVADRERPARRAERRGRHRDRDGRHRCADPTAGERRGRVHAPGRH